MNIRQGERGVFEVWVDGEWYALPYATDLDEAGQLACVHFGRDAFEARYELHAVSAIARCGGAA